MRGSPILMMQGMNPTPSEIHREVERAAAGDSAALGRLLEACRDRLRRLVTLRLDPRLRGRVDASDVIQEGYLDAADRLQDYLADPQRMPFYLWLRFLVGQRVQEQHRRHFNAAATQAARSRSTAARCPASTAALAAHLLGKLTSPSQAAMRAEQRIRLQEALNAMDSIDREILVLRHYEQMTNGEVAMVLGLDKSAATKRYIRALMRLKGHLGNPDASNVGG